MRAEDVAMVSLLFGEKFHRSKTGFKIGNMVVKLNRVFHSKRPKGDVISPHVHPDPV